MEIKIKLQDYKGNLADLCSKIEWSTSISGQCGKLNLYLQQDPSGQLKLRNGLQVKLIVDGVGLFLGYVFKLGMDNETTYKVDCYDQLYYLKNKEVYMTQEQTASEIFTKICTEQGFKHNVKTPTSLKLQPYLHYQKALYVIIKRGLDQHLINTKEYCFIIDNFGVIEFTNVETELTDLIISDTKLALSYKYEIDISPDTFNYIKVVRNNYETGLRDVWITKDSYTMSKWGHLQKLVIADETDNEEQIKLLSEQLLTLYNRERRTLKIIALGNINLKAGSGIILKLERLNIQQNMWIKNITHKLEKDLHTMEMELMIV